MGFTTQGTANLQRRDERQKEKHGCLSQLQPLQRVRLGLGLGLG